jgi:REP element-mobilizing transposase RayT
MKTAGVSRVPRSELPSYGVFHITARGVDRCVIFRDRDDYGLFTIRFLRVMRKEGLQVHAYCWMPNHYHAVIEGPMEAISRAFHWLNGFHAREFNARHGRIGHLLQERFHSKVVENDGHFGRACEYVWDNPVRAGLCATRGDWPWIGGQQLLRRR